MRIQVSHDIDDLANDLASVTRRIPRDMKASVRTGIRLGSQEAKTLARRSAGAHGKHYPKSITTEMHGPSLFGATYSGEYGPNPGMPQGGMSFERGSRNQPPHLDLSKSADLVAPAFFKDVHDKTEDWFW